MFFPKSVAERIHSRTRLWITGFLVFAPLITLGLGAFQMMRGIVRYLTSEARLSGVISAEATRALGREVRIGDFKIVGDLWNLDSPKRLILKDLFIAETTAPNSPPILQTKEATLWFNWSQALLEPSLSLARLDSVQLTQPEVTLTRDPKGQWNFASLIKPSEKPSRPLLSRLTVVGGTLRYADAALPTGEGTRPPPFITTVKDIMGVVLLRPEGLTSIDLKGKGDPQLLRDIHVVTTVVPAKPTLPAQILAQVTASEVQLNRLNVRLPARAKTRFLSGVADLRLTYLDTPQSVSKEPISPGITGEIKLSQARIETATLKESVTTAQVTAQFTQEGVQIEGQAETAGMPIRLTGAIYDLPWLVAEKGKRPDPAFRVTGEMPNVEVSRVWSVVQAQIPAKSLALDTRRRLASARGRGSLRLQAAGTFAAPNAEVVATFDSLATGAYRASDVRLHATYANRVVQADLRGQYARGRWTGRAVADTNKNGQYAFVAQGRGVELADVMPELRDSLRGSAQFDVAGEGVAGKTPYVQVRAEATDLEYRKQGLSELALEGAWKDNIATVRYLRAQDPKGYLIAHGAVNTKSRTLDLSLAGNEIDFGALTLAYRQAFPPPRGVAPAEAPAIEGVAYLRGQNSAAARLTGTWDAPQLSGRATAYNVRVGDIELDRANAAFDVTRDVLIVTQGDALRSLGKFHFAGILSEFTSNAPQYTLTARAEDLELNDLLRLAGQNVQNLDLIGTISTDSVQITGEGSKFIVRDPFTISIENASFKGLPIENAFLRLSYANEKITLEEAQAQIAQGRLSGSGTVGVDGRLDLNFTLQDEDLGRLTTALTDGTSRWQGVLDARALIRGEASDPQITLNMNAQNVQFNAFAFGDLQGSARYQDKRLTLENLTLVNLTNQETGGGRFEIPDLSYDTESRALTGRANWSDIRFQRLRDLLASVGAAAPAPQPDGTDWAKLTQSIYEATEALDGATSGQVEIAGTDREPQIAFRWDNTEMRLGNYPVTLLAGSASFANRTVQAPQIRFRAEDGVIEGKINQLQLDGDIDAEIAAIGVNLNILRNWLDPTKIPEIKGTGTIGAAFTGKTRAPEVRASVNLSDVEANGQRIDRINLDDITLADGVIKSESLSVVKGKTLLRGRGQIEGFVWEAPFLPKTAKTSFQVSLTPRDAQDQNLALIGELAGGGATNGSVGQFAAVAGATGTVENPLETIFGNLTLKAERLQIPGFSTGLSNVDAELRFDGDRVSITRFKGATRVYSAVVSPAESVEVPLTLSGSLPHGFGKEVRARQGDGIQISAKRFVFRESPLPGSKSGGVRGSADLNLQISGSVKEPFLSGNIAVSDANLTLPREFGAPPGGALQLPINPRFNLTVTLGREVRLASSQLNARADGQVTLAGSLADPRLAGELLLREGQLVFPTARFTLLPVGRVTIAYPDYEVGPSGARGEAQLSMNIDIRAQTTLSAVSYTGVPRIYRVTVAANGPLTGMQADPTTGRPLLNLQFTSNPSDLAQSPQALTDRLLGLIGGIEAFGLAGRNNSGVSLSEQLTSMFTGSVLSGVLDRPARSLGFDTLALSVGSAQNLNLNISRRLFGPLYISYDRSLSAVRQLYTLRASLRFQERFQFSYEINESNEQRVLFEGVVRF